MTAPNSILPILRRRLTRVRARFRPDELPEEVMDDVYLLWRVIETSFPRDLKLNNQEFYYMWCDTATGYVDLAEVPGLAAFLEALKYLEDAAEEELRLWFGDKLGQFKGTKSFARRVADLRDGCRRFGRLRRADAGALGKLIYGARNAIVHASLETNNQYCSYILTPMRDALVEILIAFWAEQAQIPYARAKEALEG